MAVFVSSFWDNLKRAIDGEGGSEVAGTDTGIGGTGGGSSGTTAGTTGIGMAGGTDRETAGRTADGATVEGSIDTKAGGTGDTPEPDTEDAELRSELLSLPKL